MLHKLQGNFNAMTALNLSVRLVVQPHPAG